MIRDEEKGRSARLNLVMIILLCLAQSGLAAGLVFQGQLEDFWNGTAFVLVAHVVDVHHREREATQYFDSTLDPLVCVAGLFNPAEHPRIVIEFDASAGHPVWLHPVAGDLVMVVIYDRTKLGVPREGFSLANGECRFMPGNQPMIQLKGMDDPAILDVLHKMQAARPTTSPSTEPTRHP